MDEADIQAAITALGPLPYRRANEFAVAGLDLGVKQDHSALVVVVGNRDTQQLRLAHAQSWAPSPVTRKVDLIAVERAVIEAHQRFGLESLGYDPHQAALMAQRCQLRGVPMKELTFTGANLTRMASTLLDVFRSRRLELFPHPRLIADLSRLTIEEKSYGYRLTAMRDETGHADLAVALTIALPFAVDEAGHKPVYVGPMFDCMHVYDTATVGQHGPLVMPAMAPERMDDGLTDLEREAQLYGYDVSGKWELKNMMRLMGRLNDGVPGIRY